MADIIGCLANVVFQLFEKDPLGKIIIPPITATGLTGLGHDVRGQRMPCGLFNFFLKTNKKKGERIHHQKKNKLLGYKYWKILQLHSARKKTFDVVIFHKNNLRNIKCRPPPSQKSELCVSPVSVFPAETCRRTGTPGYDPCKSWCRKPQWAVLITSKSKGIFTVVSGDLRSEL